MKVERDLEDQQRNPFTPASNPNLVAIKCESGASKEWGDSEDKKLQLNIAQSGDITDILMNGEEQILLVSIKYNLFYMRDGCWQSLVHNCGSVYMHSNYILCIRVVGREESHS